MTSEHENLIKRFNDHVHMLMAKYTALENEYGLLVQENQELRERVGEQEIKVETLEQQYNTAKVATSVLAKETDDKEARSEIDKIVREIDDCIALLNR